MRIVKANWKIFLRSEESSIIIIKISYNIFLQMISLISVGNIFHLFQIKFIYLIITVKFHDIRRNYILNLKIFSNL